MTYRLIYNDNTLSCVIANRGTLDEFARIVDKNKPVVVVIKIRRKFKQVELPFEYQKETA